MKLLLTALILGAVLLPAQSPKAKNIHTIYIAPLRSHSSVDNRDFDALLRSKLIDALVDHCGSRCTILEENPDAGADAVLSGSVSIESDGYHYHAQAAMRLVNRDGAVVWGYTLHNSPFARSVTSSIADKTAKKLVAFLNGKTKD